MKKKYRCFFLLTLLAMPHAILLMEVPGLRDSSTSSNGASQRSSSASSFTESSSSSPSESPPLRPSSFSVSDERASSESPPSAAAASAAAAAPPPTLASIRGRLQEKRDVRDSYRLLPEFPAALGEEGAAAGQQYNQPRSCGSWRAEQQRLGQRQPTPIAQASRGIRRSRSLLPEDVPTQPNLPPSRDPRMSSWNFSPGRPSGRPRSGSVDGHHEYPHRRGSQEVTVIHIPPGANLAFPDPSNPHRRFIVSSRPGSFDRDELPGLPGSGDGSHHDHHSYDKKGIDYDQLYRFRDYPLVAALIICFDCYPKVTLLAVALATVLTIWKYKAVMDFFEKAKEKTMENGKPKPVQQQPVSRNKEGWFNLEKMKQKLSLLRARVSRFV